MNLAMAVQMNQPQIDEIVRAPVLLGKHMMNVHFLAIFEVLATDRAEAVLLLVLCHTSNLG